MNRCSLDGFLGWKWGWFLSRTLLCMAPHDPLQPAPLAITIRILRFWPGLRLSLHPASLGPFRRSLHLPPYRRGAGPGRLCDRWRLSSTFHYPERSREIECSLIERRIKGFCLAACGRSFEHLNWLRQAASQPASRQPRIRRDQAGLHRLYAVPQG
jgi:hypothetical protein